jgi:hypothetical protein
MHNKVTAVLVLILASARVLAYSVSQDKQSPEALRHAQCNMWPALKIRSQNTDRAGSRSALIETLGSALCKANTRSRQKNKPQDISVQESMQLDPAEMKNVT